jgi:transglutaminase superfamily protein
MAGSPHGVPLRATGRALSQRDAPETPGGGAPALPLARARDRPEPDLVLEREDFFGKKTASFSMQRGHSHLSVTATSEVEVGSPAAGQVSDVPWEEAAEVLRHDLDPERLPRGPPVHPGLAALRGRGRHHPVRVSLRPGGLLLESVAKLSARIHRDFAYVPGFTSVTTPLSVAEPQPKRSFPPHADHPITHRPVRHNSTGCKTTLNLLSFTR